ncbi:MAG: CAP domain-containing protein [bacterium]|nr:CAP domain-containing protein [bacterium]
MTKRFLSIFLVLNASLSFASNTNIGKAFSTGPMATENPSVYLSDGKESIIPTADEIKLDSLVNAARQNPSSVGWGSYSAVPPLKANINLWKASIFHSREMVDSGYFQHDSYRSGGAMYESCRVRIMTRFAYTPDPGGGIGENIAGNYTVELAFQAWLTSTGHRNNIFSANYTEHGIGIVDGGTYGKMFTHDFGKRSIVYDLTAAVSDISFSITNPMVGNTVQITAVIHELQKTHAFPVIVEFYDGDPSSGGTLIGTDKVDAIINYNGTENAVISWNTTGKEPGNHDIWVKIDPGNKFTETNEGNNSTYKSISLGQGTEESEKANSGFSLSVVSDKEVNISYSLDCIDKCLLRIYDCCGNLVNTLVNGKQTAGIYRVDWNKTDLRAKKVPAGIYFCNLVSGTRELTKKIIILK